MTSWVVHIFLGGLILIGFLVSPTLSCSPEITARCRCEQFLSGMSLDCNNTDFSKVTETIRKLKARVQRLTVRDSDIGELKAVDLKSLFVKHLHLPDNGITRLEPGALWELSESLESLDLSNNSLADFPDMSQLPKLKSVNLNGNQLTGVPDRVFIQNPLVNQLRLERNQICSLGSEALAETKGKLELLDLSDNCFQTVPAQTLRGFQQLKFLDLSNNEFTEIGNLQFVDLPMLLELRLDGNGIAQIIPMAFQNVPELKHLYLSDNRIATVEGNKFQAFRKLQLLDLSRNQLTKLKSSSFKGIAELNQLFLGHNQIDTIEPRAFSQNPKLQMISLQNNNVKTLQPKAFDLLPGMLMLLLGNNSLQQIDRGMFDGMANLQQLNLRNNSISAIEVSSFDSVPKLTTLDLGWNRIQSMDPNFSLSKLESLFWLDLSNNGLEMLPEDVFTSKIANIILDGNQLVCDDSFDWFISYLVKFNSRIHLPNQEEVACVAPPEMAGSRLKDLQLQRANETLAEAFKDLLPSGINDTSNLLGDLVPGLTQFGTIAGLSKAIPGFGDIAGVLPQLENIVGFGANRKLPMSPENLEKALSNFANPLSRISSGSEPTLSDLTGFVESIPDLVDQLPSAPDGGKDLSKAPLEVQAFIINGGEVPGVPKALLDNYVKQYMKKMAAAAQRVNNGDANAARELLPVTALSKELLAKIVQGQSLPGLTAAQIGEVRKYYTKALAQVMSPKTKKIPDLEREPPMPDKNSFERYNIRDLDMQDDRMEAQAKASKTKIAIYTGIGVAIVAAITIVAIGVLCYMRRRPENRSSQASIIGEDQDSEKGAYLDSGRPSPIPMPYNSGHPAPPNFQPPPAPTSQHPVYQSPGYQPVDQSAIRDDLRTPEDLRRTEM